MTDRKSLRLDQLGSVARGKSRHRPRNDPALYGGQWPFFQTGDVKSAELYLRKFTQTYSELGLAQSKLWPVGTLCITIAANIADTAILGIPGCFPDSVVGFIADPAKADIRFIKYYIDTIKQGMQNASRGTTQDNLSVDKLLTFDFLVPPAKRQREIAAILSAYDDLIENNTRRIAILEEMARRIYEEWFVRFRFPGHEHTRMVDSPLGPVPEGWRVVPLAQMVATQYGYTESATDTPIGPKFLRGMDINKQPFIDWSAVPYCPIDADNFSKFKLSVGDVVVIRMADPGKIGIVEKNVEAVFASYLVRLRIVDERLSPYLLFYFLTSERYQDYITGVSTGTTRKSASAPVITGITFTVPPANVMEQFMGQVTPLRKLLNLLLEKNTNLRTTRDLLLPKLISGELDVSDLPEPQAVAA